MKDRIISEIDPDLKVKWDALTPRSKEVLNEYLSFELEDAMKQISITQSPIEEMMMVALRYVTRIVNFNIRRADPHSSVICRIQKEIESEGYVYVVDFLIDFYYKEEHYLFVLECDGHDFHEKTKEQVRSDKERERNLLASGYTVIRFTGSEIYNDSFECATEALTIIQKRLGIFDELYGESSEGQT